MRRIGRYILNGLTLLSLVLCVAAVVLWVRSYWVVTMYSVDRGWIDGAAYRSRYYSLFLGRGEVITDAFQELILDPEEVLAFARITKDHWEWTRRQQPTSGWLCDQRLNGPPATREWAWGRFLVSARADARPYEYFNIMGPGLCHPMRSQRLLRLPFWFIVLATAVFPMFRAPFLARGARTPSGFCERCGYDLRATPERCPECGGLVEART